MTRAKGTPQRNRITPSIKEVKLTKRFSMKKSTILIVDDDPAVRDVFQIIFENAGYDVQLAGDGFELMNNNFAKPDVFLIDKLLSGINGLDICRHLKSLEWTRNVPVIMISASPGIATQSMEAGADDYIEKPFERDQLLQVVARNIPSHKNKSKKLQ